MDLFGRDKRLSVCFNFLLYDDSWPEFIGLFAFILSLTYFYFSGTVKTWFGDDYMIFNSFFVIEII